MAFQLSSCILTREFPLYGPLLGVAGLLPCINFGLHDIAELARGASACDLAAAMKKLGVPLKQAAQIVPSQ
jgi:hypothetical protein